jgi:YD repeat-containing protein
MSLFLTAVLTVAHAVMPPPILAPDGARWLGTLPPTDDSWADVVVVDPDTGRLWIGNNDAPGSSREWDGAEWKLGEPIEGVIYGYSGESLVAVTDARGIMRRYVYDQEKRVRRIVWPNGAVMHISYDEHGRVVELQGPSSRRMDFRWSRAVEVSDSMGRRLNIVRRDEGDRRIFEVRDGQGRMVRSIFNDGRIVGWVDPKGLETVVEWSDGVNIVDDLGRSWKLRTDGEGRLLQYRSPFGRSWEWERDQQSRLMAVSSPLGEVLAVERDETGAVRSLSRADGSIGIRTTGNGTEEYTDTMGPLFRIHRDGQGRIVGIEDPAGGLVRFVWDSLGLSEVIDRSKSSWVLERDSMAKINRVISPTGLVISLDRDLLGNIRKIKESFFGEVMLDRDGGGDIIRIQDAEGRRIGLLRDGSGEVRSIRYPEGNALVLERDVLGNIASLEKGGLSVAIRRDLAGEVVEFDGMRIGRDADGLIGSIETPQGLWAFARDTLGRLAETRFGDYRMEVERDLVGRPILWKEGNKEYEVKRDLRGRVVESQPDGIRLHRSAQGWVSAAVYGEDTWKWLYSAGGHLLKVLGPNGVGLGLNRQPSGEIEQIRYPNGAFIQYSRDGRIVEELHHEDDGQVLGRMRYGMGKSGAWNWVDDGEQTMWVHRDTLDEVVAIDSGESLFWSKSPDGVFDEKSGFVIIDDSGRPVGAQTVDDLEVWNLPSGYLSYQRDDLGRIERIISGEEQVLLRYDSLSRVDQVCREWRCWTFEYDPRGLLLGYTPPNGSLRGLLWRPDGLDRRSVPWDRDVLLSVGGAQWVQGPLGLSVHSWDGEKSILDHDLQSNIRWVLTESPRLIQSSFLGQPSKITQELVGSPERLVLADGGPSFSGAIALDPLSGQRLDGKLPPWWGPTDNGFSYFVDVTPFSPTSAWGDPIAVLDDMQQLSIAEPGWDLRRSPPCSSAAWLPPGMEGETGQLIDGDELPLRIENHIVKMYAQKILWGQADPLPDEFARLLIQHEVGDFEPFEGAIQPRPWWMNQRKSHPVLAELPRIE